MPTDQLGQTSKCYSSRSLASAKSSGIWSIYISSRIYPAIFPTQHDLVHSHLLLIVLRYCPCTRHCFSNQCMTFWSAGVSQPPQTHGEETADREEAEKLDELPNWPMFSRPFSRFVCECFQHVMAFRFPPNSQETIFTIRWISTTCSHTRWDPNLAATPSWTSAHLSWLQ